MPSCFRDESGVALGLAVIAVVIFGVVGAGLLVFVRNDLESSIQTGQARKAFYAADAGVQAAKRELLGDAHPASYDDDGGVAACDSVADVSSPRASAWSVEDGGRDGSLGDSTFHVEIRWLSAGCGAPDGGAEPGARFFEIVSVGKSGEARREIQAIYSTSDVDAPLTTFATGDVTLSGAKVSGGSIFSGRNVTATGTTTVSGADLVYGRWSDGGRLAARPDDAAGIGAAGDSSEVPAPTPRYDSASSPRFSAQPASGELGFPFDPDYWRSAAVLDFVAEESASQGNSESSAGTLDWPNDSSGGTLVFVETALAGEASLSESDCPGANPCLGTLVVAGGDLRLKSGATFEGCIVTADGDITVESGAKLRGFANSTGDLDVAGEIEAFGVTDSLSCTGFHGVDVWSWRETYE